MQLSIPSLSMWLASAAFILVGCQGQNVPASGGDGAATGVTTSPTGGMAGHSDGGGGEAAKGGGGEAAQGGGGEAADGGGGQAAGCSSPGDCPAAEHCDGGVCVPDKQQGQPCASGEQCSSDNCSDGVCCDAACTGLCEACKGALTGKWDGACGPITVGSDPDGECPLGQLCNGQGSCVAAGSCGNGVCDVAETAASCKVDCGVLAMAAGSGHSCAVLADGTVRCWGANLGGQLGDGVSLGGARD